MLNNIHFDKVYLSCRETDMRKSINGLAVIVQEAFSLDPFENTLYVFYNRGRDKIKILKWDRNGFWLYYKRLEKGKLQFPSYEDGSAAVISEHELRCLLDGLTLEQASNLGDYEYYLSEVKERKLV